MSAAPKPRKQARQARARATQAAILEAAARILEQQGRDALTTNAIALLAGVSIGSLYQYFPNKEAILATLIRDKRQELLDLMRAASETGRDKPVEQAVDALIHAGMVHQFQRPRLALELEYIEPQLALEPETQALSAQMAALILPVIRRVRPDATPQEAADIVAICKGLINAAALAGEPGGESLYLRCRRAVLGFLHQPGIKRGESSR